MRLPLLLLLLLEMAGTCYIITEGGKTHTFRQYLQPKTQTENIPTILNSRTFQGCLKLARTAWQDSQAVSEPDKQSHLSALCRSLISHCNGERPGPIGVAVEKEREKKKKTFLQVPSSVFRVRTCKQCRINTINTLSLQTVNTLSPS